MDSSIWIFPHIAFKSFTVKILNVPNVNGNFQEIPSPLNTTIIFVFVYQAHLLGLKEFLESRYGDLTRIALHRPTPFAKRMDAVVAFASQQEANK